MEGADLRTDGALLVATPAEQCDAVLARVVDRHDYPEIADEPHCSSSVVRQRVSRGLRAMRSDLEVPEGA